MKQGKIVISNIIMMLISIAAIVTLLIGSFMKIDLTLKINGETISKIQGNGDAPSGSNASESGGSSGSSGSSSTSGSGSSSGSGGITEEDVLKQINVTLPLVFDFKSMNLIKAVAADPTKEVRDTLSRQVSSVVDSLMSAVDDIMSAMVNVVIDQTVKQAEEAIKEQIKEEIGGEVSEEEIKQTLSDKYGVTDKDVETLKKEVSDTMTALLNGETDDAAQCLEKSETLDKLINAYAKEEWKKQNPEATSDPTAEQLAEQATSMKKEIIDSYNEVIDEMKVDGKIGKETVIVKVMENMDVKDENGNEVKIENMDDVKKVLADKLNAQIDEGTANYIGIALKAMGGFVLVVVAAWAYFLIKLIVKTLFSRNKTVGMFAPRFFGWMPHVLFVGAPMLLFGNMDKIIAKASENSTLEGAAEMLKQISELMTIKITSLTWVSAVATVLLLIIWIPYYRWRRQLKRELKGVRN